MKRDQRTIEAKLKNLALFGLAFHQFNKDAEKELKLSLVQFHVLKEVLNSPGLSAQTLARQTKVHPSSLTQTMKILVRKGLLFVDENPRDSRMKIILATRAGKLAVDRFLEEIPESLAVFLESDVKNAF